MERNITQALNKPPAAASWQLRCEVHSGFTGAAYLDVEYFIHSAARNTAQSPGMPRAETAFDSAQGREGCSSPIAMLCTSTVCNGNPGGAMGRDRAEGPPCPQAPHCLLWGDSSPSCSEMVSISLRSLMMAENVCSTVQGSGQQSGNQSGRIITRTELRRYPDGMKLNINSHSSLKSSPLGSTLE